MKKQILLILCILTCLVGFSQRKSSINLTNAIVIGQFDKEDDRYNLEVALTEFFVEKGIKAVPSLNLLKQGAELTLLLSDTLQTAIQAKGMDTYVLCTVRGYDRKYKPTTKQDDLKTVLSFASLFSIYREEVISVTFEFLIYRNNQLILTDLVRCGNVSSKEKVLIRLKKKMEKRIAKW